MAAATAEHSTDSQSLQKFFNESKTVEGLKTLLSQSNGVANLAREISELNQLYYDIIIPNPRLQSFFSADNKLHPVFRKLRMYPHELSTGKIDLHNEAEMDELFNLIDVLRKDRYFPFIVNPTLRARILETQGEHAGTHPEVEAEKAEKEKAKEKTDEPAESTHSKLGLAETIDLGQTGDIEYTPAQKAENLVRSLPKPRIGGFLSSTGIRVVSLIRRIPRERLIPALALGAAGLAAAGPAGAGAGLVVGYLAGQTIIEPIARGGASLPSATAPQSVQPSAQPNSTPQQAQPSQEAPPDAPQQGRQQPRQRRQSPAIPPIFGTPFGGKNLFSFALGPGKVVWISIIGVIIGVAILMLFSPPQNGGGSSGGGGSASQTATTTATSTDIAQCSFYFNGKPTKIGSSGISSLISDAANKAGIPPAVLAGIVERESQSAIASTDQSYITNDFDNHNNYGCDLSNPNTCAFGVAQFQPPTFSSIFDAHKDELANLGKTSVDTTPISQSDYTPGSSVFRIVSVKDSILAAAFAIKDYHAGVTSDSSLWDDNTILAVGEKYYTGNTKSGCPDNYCDDLISDYKACTVQPQIPIALDTFPAQLVAKILGSDSCIINGAAVVSTSDENACVASIQPIPQLCSDAISSSVFGVQGGVLQCVGFVKAALNGASGTTLDDHGVSNACDYASNPPTGYDFIPHDANVTIQVGDIAVWGCNYDSYNSANNFPNGHVAVVVGVDGGNDFEVAEANFGLIKGKVEIRPVNRNEFDFLGWDRKR